MKTDRIKCSASAQPTRAVGNDNEEAYRRTKSLLTSLSQSMADLENEMSVQQKELSDTSARIDEIIMGEPGALPEYNGSFFPPSEGGQRDVDMALRQELQRESQAVAQSEAEIKDLRARLQHAQKLSAQAADLQKAVDERDLRLAALAKDLLEQNLTNEEKAQKQEALHAAELRIAELTTETQRLQEEIQTRDGLMAHMQKEAAMSTKTLQTAAKAIANVREHNVLLETELEQQRQQLKESRDELGKVQRQMAEKEQALQTAEHRIGRLEQAMHELDANLEQENQDKQIAQKQVAKSKEEVIQARMRINELTEKMGGLEKQVSQKNASVAQLKNQQAKTSLALEQANQSLQAAQSQIQSLEQQMVRAQEALKEEVEASTSALKSAASREQALRLSEGRVRELATENTTLKAQVASKEKTMEAVREETLKNADMLMTAQKTRKSLVEAEGKLTLLSQQVASLEDEIRSRDSLLDDIKAETFKSAETLKMAAKVNLLLNETREREAELQENLEEKDDIIGELQRELAENARAARAEQALRAAEQRRRELEEENEALRQGVNARDQALRNMEEEVERSAEVLDAGQQTREKLRRLQARTGDLEAQLKSRDASVAALQSELTALKLRASHAEQGRPQQQANAATNNSRPLGVAQSISDLDPAREVEQRWRP
ncbi:hypothetical protein KFL_001010270 [Klebsormidium nitens]|uniref:Uncharacterized protein n=1 Tax=Klebsormidium nitens TaxID=105231 RepID=A0A1Y1HWH9_KLENI|nr:hypothetical protein KFL_001010270 [Klebsormidium nitens]|eukprot:GAQ82142.1 hypothetical protein KFL_001010270 [Klebsormidium nitens]